MEWQERLTGWFIDDYYKLVTNEYSNSNSLEVVEEQKDGQGKVEFLSRNSLLKINSGCKNHLVYLKDRKDTDGVFLEFSDNDREIKAIHFVELKKNINAQKWQEIKEQTRSSLKHSLGFLGVLNLPMVERIYCHVCFQNDDMKTQSQAAPILKKVVTGKKIEERSEWKEFKEWNSDEVVISEIFPKFKLAKHQLESIANNPIPYKQVNLND